MAITLEDFAEIVDTCRKYAKKTGLTFDQAVKIYQTMEIRDALDGICDSSFEIKYFLENISQELNGISLMISNLKSGD